MCARRRNDLWRVATTLVLLLCAASTNANAGAIARATARLPEIPAPPQTKMEWIARSMKMNGLPMTLQSLRSQLPPAAVLAHFSQWWTLRTEGARGGARTIQEAQWLILALTSPDLHITVRIAAAAIGSTGTLVVSRNPAAISPSLATDFPHSPAAKVVNLQEYEDGGVFAEHISLQSVRSAAKEAHHFRRLLERAGWSIYRDEMSRTSPGTRVLEAQKGANVAQLTCAPAPSSGTHIVVIWRKG